MVRGKFQFTLRDIMQTADWRKACELGNNPNKTKIVLFIERNKYTAFKSAILHDVDKQLSLKAKCLDVILTGKF